MRSYLFYIEDCRYTVPQFLTMDAPSDGMALDSARQYLARSANYLAIDVLDGEREVGRVER